MPKPPKKETEKVLTLITLLRMYEVSINLSVPSIVSALWAQAKYFASSHRIALVLRVQAFFQVLCGDIVIYNF